MVTAFFTIWMINTIVYQVYFQQLTW